MGGHDPDDRNPSPIPPAMGGTPVEPDLLVEDSGAAPARSDGVGTIDLADLDAEWTEYFRYETVYADQASAIETFLDLLADNGLYLLEGACGTGKTLAAITGGLHAIRDRGHLSETRCDGDEQFPRYSRLVVVTPVKQQLAQFVAEMQGINESLPAGTAQIPTVVMRGRGDMMPYSYVDLPPLDEGGVGDRANDLREMTRAVIEFGSDVPLDWPDGLTPPAFSLHDYDWDDSSTTAEQYREDYRYDPYRAAAVREIVSRMASSAASDHETLTVDGVETPYPDYVPHTNDIVDADQLRLSGRSQLPMDLQGKFDPFYAGVFAGEGGLPFGFDEADSFVFDRSSLFEAAASRGICPHTAMARFAGQADVVLGNYAHLFDPQTRLLTDDKIGLLDEETIAVVDEAHRIERTVRDMLSTDLDIYTLDRAISDVEIALQYASGQFENSPTPDLRGEEAARTQSLVTSALGTAGRFSVDVEDLAEAVRFLRFAKRKLGEYGAATLEDRYPDASWQEAIDGWGPEPLERPLADPEKVGDTDDFTAAVAAHGEFGRSNFRAMYPVMLGVKFVFDALESEGIYDRTPQGVGVGKFFRRWVDEDPVDYHHQVVLDDSLKDTVPESFPDWVRGWTPRFQLFNCVPRDELRDVFAELGGGVLMSATIQPTDVFEEGVGIDDVPYPAKEDDDEENEGDEDDDEGGEGPSDVGIPDAAAVDDSAVRPTKFEQYPLRFPRENRLSMTVDLPRYTHDNRGSPTQDPARLTDTRRAYAKLLREIVDTQGNVLVAMPNYREAKWAYEFLEGQNPSTRLLLDQSSSARETTETLESFFEGGDAAIFTSCRGTITEGVDYDGDKLQCCAVVGIPLLPTHTPRIQAIRTAYDERMDSRSGFETALTIPAVRKVRQAIGRVIRGQDEPGVRLLLDERYASQSWDGVETYLSEQERREFSRTRPERVGPRIAKFWNQAPPRQAGEDAGETGSQEESDRSSNTGKIYFGKEATLTGWVEVDLDVIEDDIVPLVREHEVKEEEDIETINLNFTKGLSVSGWTDVRAEVVREKIEPIAAAGQPGT